MVIYLDHMILQYLRPPFHLADEAKCIDRHTLIDLLELFNACLILCMLYRTQNMTPIKETQHID